MSTRIRAILAGVTWMGLLVLGCGDNPAPSDQQSGPSVTPTAPIARPNLAVTPIPEVAAELASLKQFEMARGDPPGVVGRLRIPRIGVDAPIVAREAPADLNLSHVNPLGPADAIWYDVKTSGFGGEPKRKQNALFSAHVDYNYSVGYAQAHYRGPGAFLAVSKLDPNDAIEVALHGQTALYGVVWVKQVPEDANWGEIYASDSPDGDGVLTLITCTGDFNPATQEYSARTVVRARLFE